MFLLRLSLNICGDWLLFSLQLRLTTTVPRREKILAAPMTQETRASLIAYRAEIGQINSDHKTYTSKSPAPIDWAAYKSKL